MFDQLYLVFHSAISLNDCLVLREMCAIDCAVVSASYL